MTLFERNSPASRIQYSLHFAFPCGSSLIKLNFFHFLIHFSKSEFPPDKIRVKLEFQTKLGLRLLSNISQLCITYNAVGISDAVLLDVDV